MQNLQATLPLDHVAVAVPSIEEHRAHYESLTGEICSPPVTISSQGVRVAFVGMIELLEPMGPETTVGRFLDKRGVVLHHIAYRTPDIQRELECAVAKAWCRRSSARTDREVWPHGKDTRAERLAA